MRDKFDIYNVSYILFLVFIIVTMVGGLLAIVDGDRREKELLRICVEAGNLPADCTAMVGD